MNDHDTDDVYNDHWCIQIKDDKYNFDSYKMMIMMRRRNYIADSHDDDDFHNNDKFRDKY